ncbi:MAG TPA: hypothetical protein VLE97_01920 [Gaiellaceae bacterium]|nr:hypothetical protein [Gaiellaceae bacterium]
MTKEAPVLDDSVRSARAIGDLQKDHPELFDEPDTRTDEEKALAAATDPHAKDDKGGKDDKGAAATDDAAKIAADKAAADADADAAAAKATDDAAKAAAAKDDDKGDGKGGKGGIPKVRFDEVVTERNETRLQLERMAAQLRERDERDAAAERQRQEAAKNPPRDFDKEFDGIEEEYEAGTMTEREYRTKIRKLEQDRVDFKLEQSLKPVIEKEAEREEREALEEVNSAIDAEAQKMIKIYPMLDHNNKATADVEAINAVVAERDANIALGMEPAKALRLAVAEIADKRSLKRAEAGAAETPQQRVERERLAASAKAAAGASAIPASPTDGGGKGERGNAEKSPLEAMSPKEWKGLTKAQQDEYLGRV